MQFLEKENLREGILEHGLITRRFIRLDTINIFFLSRDLPSDWSFNLKSGSLETPLRVCIVMTNRKGY